VRSRIAFVDRYLGVYYLGARPRSAARERNGRAPGHRWIALAADAHARRAAAPSEAEDSKQAIFDTVDRNAAQMTAISDARSISANRHAGDREREAFEGTLEAAGFRVELGGAMRPICGLRPVQAGPRRDRDRGRRAAGRLADAGRVRPASRWCPAPRPYGGHNTHGGVATVTARRQASAGAAKLPGTVAISFGPAEEQLRRPFLVRAGYFKDVDAIIYLHLKENMATGYGLRNYAAISSVFTFHGRTAHGAVNPWEGRTRHAVELMDLGPDKLRETCGESNRPTHHHHRRCAAQYHPGHRAI
jgi:aminobenzoyl-glutamate utilization protein B